MCEFIIVIGVVGFVAYISWLLAKNMESEQWEPTYTIQTTSNGKFKIVCLGVIYVYSTPDIFYKEYKTYKAAKAALDKYLDKQSFKPETVYSTKGK